MKVKADRDEVSIALYSCPLKVKVRSYTLDEMTLVSWMQAMMSLIYADVQW